MLIVGLGHRKGVGKNYAASLLEKTLCPLDIQLTSFAYKLKHVCFQLYSWDGMQHPDFYEEHPERKNDMLPTIGKTVRQIWIELGTPAIRDVVYQDTWIMCALKNNRARDLLIITDLRFPNEAKAILMSGGILVKIERDSVKPTDDVADCALQDRANWHYILKNNGTQTDLSLALTPLITEIKRRVNG